MSKEEKIAKALGITVAELRWLIYLYQAGCGMNDYQITAELQRQIDKRNADMRDKE